MTSFSCSTTTLALAALLLAPVSRAAQDIDQSLPTGAKPSVEVVSPAGLVKVTGWNQNLVKVTGTLADEEDEFEMTGDADHVVIKVRRESGHHGRNERTELNINLPRDASLEVSTVSADIDVRELRGPQRLESVSGGIDTTVFDQQLDLRTISGNAVITGAAGRAPVFVESVSGDLRASGLNAEVEAQSVSGELVLELGRVPRARFQTVSGDVTASLGLGAQGRFDVETISGEVGLTLQQPVDARFDIETHSGDIDNCFGPEVQRKSKYAPGRELRFTEGNGGAHVRIDTLSGDVELCRR